MKPPISINLDSNERGSERAKALAFAVGGDPTYDLAGFAELPVDMAFSLRPPWPGCEGECGNGVGYLPEKHVDECNACPCLYSRTKILHVELKEIPDFWASKASGHLGTQVLQMVAAGSPAFVAVFGSLQEVMSQVPRVSQANGRVKRRSGLDIAQDANTARAFCADAAACGVPLFFLSTNHQQSFIWILSMAKHILTGPSLASWLPRFPADPAGYGMLCSIRGIGHEAALALLQAYGGVEQIVNTARFDIDTLADTPVNGKRLGAAKAGLIARAVGV